MNPGTRRIIFPLLIFFHTAFFVQAQDYFFPREIYLIPQTIFVGDKGRLVAVLGPAFEDAETFILQSPAEIQRLFQQELIGDAADSGDLVIDRVELEKRNNQIRLLIDFIPYVPGLLSIPPIRIRSSGPEPLIAGGLELNVASILTPETMSLAESALPMVIPGTGFIVYGAVFGLLILLFLVICGILWGRKSLYPFLDMLKRRRLLGSLERLLQQLRSDSMGNDPVKQQELFSLLAREFREFLSYFTGINCRAFTPPEFLNLPVLVSGRPDYLCGLFRNWDRLRFSGGSIDRREILKVLDELGFFISSIDKTEKGP